MGYEFLLSAIHEIGYIAFFFALCLGLIGLPIPNEVVVMTGGAIAASGILSPLPAFITIFLGISSGLTFGYFVGKAAGAQVSNRFVEKKNFRKFLASSEQMSAKYGSFAISLCIFLPLLRHITMYAVGMNRMPYIRFGIFAYSTAFIWTLIYFLLGSFVGDNLEEIGNQIYRYGMLIVWILLGAAAVYGIFQYFSTRNKKKERPL